MDLFKIGSNIASMQALNSLYKLNSKLSVHQERLSTGKRVNSAQDDTAAFSVAKNVETTKQGHERALQQVKNAQSVLSIIEASQQKQLKLMQSIKGKLVQAQDTTLNSTQRQSILEETLPTYLTMDPENAKRLAAGSMEHDPDGIELEKIITRRTIEQLNHLYSRVRFFNFFEIFVFMYHCVIVIVCLCVIVCFI